MKITEVNTGGESKSNRFVPDCRVAAKFFRKLSIVMIFVDRKWWIYTEILVIFSQSQFFFSIYSKISEIYAKFF